LSGVSRSLHKVCSISACNEEGCSVRKNATPVMLRRKRTCLCFFFCTGTWEEGGHRIQPLPRCYDAPFKLEESADRLHHACTHWLGDAADCGPSRLHAARLYSCARSPPPRRLIGHSSCSVSACSEKRAGCMRAWCVVSEEPLCLLTVSRCGAALRLLQEVKVGPPGGGPLWTRASCCRPLLECCCLTSH
jgi:hypothetical protein